jgi:acyl carrier protein
VKFIHGRGGQNYTIRVKKNAHDHMNSRSCDIRLEAQESGRLQRRRPKLITIRNATGMIDEVRGVLRDTLQLGSRADQLTADSALLGSLPELDSMAVVSLLTALEERFGISVDDDEISAENFETLGSLTEFVKRKTGA